MRPGCVRLVLCAALVAAGCSTNARPVATASVDPSDELRSLIVDVTAATAHRYRISDDRGRSMDTLKVIARPETSSFAAVYHTWNDADQAFHVHLATSTDLLSWSWQAELAVKASQPTIAAVPGGGYVVAWEQEPDPIHIVIASYPTWGALVGATPDRRFDVPVTMPACGEGTPSIESVTRDRLELGFHYHASCERDLQASGALDWSEGTWQSRQERGRDRALFEAGVTGHVGDRDRIAFRGRDVLLLDGQLVQDANGTWRTFLVDEAGHAERLTFRTDASSASFMNPTISQVRIGGRDALVVTLYLPTEGAHGGEDGPLLFYRTL